MEQTKTKTFTKVCPEEEEGDNKLLLKIEEEVYRCSGENILIPEENMICEEGEMLGDLKDSSDSEDDTNTPAENFRMCAVNYLCGFVANRIKKLKCKDCANFSSLSSKEADELIKSDQNLTLTQLRAYECSKEKNLLYGHLTVPSKLFEKDFTR